MQLLRFFVKTSFRTLALVIAFFRSLPKTHDQLTIGENGDKSCFENWELCLFRQIWFYENRIVQSSHYFTSLAYSDIQFFVLSSVTRKWNPKILELLYLFPYRLLTCSTLWSGFLEGRSTSVLAVPIFIPAVWRASAKLFNAPWRPDSVKESRTKSSANSRRLILPFLIVAHSSAWLHLSIQFM